jgi:AraC-like DNA-binding protein
MSEHNSPFTLFTPPYRGFMPITPDERLPTDPRVLRGTALIWSLGAGDDEGLLQRVAERPAGLPLMVVLPPTNVLRRMRKRVLAVAEDARPQSVLPHHPRLVPEEMARLLRRVPPDLPEEFVDYLQWRGLGLDQETRQILRRTMELSAEISTLGGLTRAVYLSRRALGRRFQTRGLPVPSHWLQLCRLLRAALRLQNSRDSLFEVAEACGYPDGFTLSNQMERMVGVRPSVARERLGWEWFVEHWLLKEWMEGGLRVRLRGLPEQMSVGAAHGSSRSTAEQDGSRKSSTKASAERGSPGTGAGSGQLSGAVS